MIGYHVSNAKLDLESLDFNKTAQGVFWVADSYTDLISSEDKHGADLYPGKEVYVHKVTYTADNPAGWCEYDRFMLGEIRQNGHDCIRLGDDTIILDKHHIMSIEPIYPVYEVRFVGRLDTEYCKMYSITTHIQAGALLTSEQAGDHLAKYGNIHGFAYRVSKRQPIEVTEQ